MPDRERGSARAGERESVRAPTLEMRAGELAQRQTVDALVEEVARILVIPRPSHVVSRDDAVREARDLIAALLDVPRHWTLLRANKWVEGEVWRRATAAARTRASGAPLQYAVGRANFRHLTLGVDSRVLIPRPETELLVDLVLARKRDGIVVDVGTGSGAIALALATEGVYERVIATDVSLDALEVARENAMRLDAPVELAQGDLLDAAIPLLGSSRVDVVVSNPPYIAFEEVRQLPPLVRDWEPALALVSATNGLAETARLVRQAATRLAPGGLLALEVDARRASLSAELVSRDVRYHEVAVHLDLAGRERFVLATRRSDR